MLALLLLATPAPACPTIATGTVDPLSFDVAQVAVVHRDGRTTFSVSINPRGAAQEFALVLPIPEAVTEKDIHTLSPDLFPVLDGYTAPRHVADAGCPSEGDADTDTDTDSDTDADAGGSVDVVGSYLVGEYEVTVLTSEESGALTDWLTAHGYYLPSGADARLAEYIGSGSYFLAAKVADTAALADGTPLSPLQVSYDSAVFSIPIRLATLNSPGEQDMVIYAVSDLADGAIGISNYPQFTVPDGCIWGDPATDSFGEAYDQLYTQGWTAMADAAWASEFTAGYAGANPAAGWAPTAEELASLGFTGPYHDHFITRLHMRYTPEQADQDLTLYASHITVADVSAYADDYPINDCIALRCDGTPNGDAGGTDTDLDGDDGDNGGTVKAEGCACGSSPAPAGVGLLMALGALVVRRRTGRATR